jgi:hypothetical protein
MAFTQKIFSLEYDRMMERTKFISQLGVFLYLVIALSELGWASPFAFWWHGVQYDPDSMITRIGMILVVTIPLFVRFIVLSKRTSAPRWLTYGSWFLVVFSLFFYYADSHNYWRPQRFVVYATYGDPLESFFWSYLNLSMIRFIITVVATSIRIR